MPLRRQRYGQCLWIEFSASISFVKSDKNRNEVMDVDLVGGDDVSRREIEYKSENGGEGDSSENRENSFDRLSALPEPLLIHILSYLETRKAASTSVLSKRWKSLWTDLPGLSFCEYGRDNEETLKLAIRVNKALSCRTVTYLDTLWISLRYDPYFVNDVNSWVEFAVKQKVKDLTLLLEWEDFWYVLPQPIYSCSSLTMLYVQGCAIEPHGSISLKHLTELVIGGVELHKDTIQKILLGCPVLHTLRLEGCWGFERLHIDSKSIYVLSIDDCEDEDEDEQSFLEISAPYLRSLLVKSFPISAKELRIKNIPSLVRALIDFDDFENSDAVVHNMMELLRSLYHVKELEADTLCVKTVCDMVVMGLPIPQSSRKSLILEAWRLDSLPGILALLESSPHLETFVLNCISRYEGSKWDFGPVEKDDLNCDLTRLKTVHLVGYADPNLGGEPMLTLARALLKRATVLEEMVVDGDELLAKHSPDDATKIAQTLLSYPKSSQNAKITFLP